LLVLCLALVACSRSHRTDGGAGTLREVAFETRAEIPVGIFGVADAVCADLDGDRRSDFAVTSLQGRVQILLGGGDGTFAPGATIVLPLHPSLLKGADIDRDGDVDLCVLSSGADIVTVLENDGRANFGERQRLTVGAWTDALAVGDCNGDGRPDLIVSNFGEALLRVFAGEAGGRFAPHYVLPLPVGASPGGLAVGDVTGDALGDLVVSDFAGERALVLAGVPGGGHAAVRRFGVGRNPLGLAIGDLDRDGLPDIAVADFSDQTISLLFAAGSDFVRTVIPVDGPPSNPAIGDVNGDGINDLVACVFDRATISVFHGERAGGLAPELQMGNSGYPFRALIDDVNRDGRPDLIATGSGDRLSLYLGRGGRLNGSVNYHAGIPTPEFVAAGDFDGDGRAEVATAGRGADRVAILSMPAATGDTAALSLRTEVAVGRPCFNVVAGDFDGDGRIDLAVPTDGGVKILGNASARGALAFDVYPPDPARTFAAGRGPFEVACGDFDRDGRTDLVVSDYLDEKLTVLLARGGFGYAEYSLRLGVADTPGGLAVADFTGDRLPDIAVSRHGASMITVLANDGIGRFSPWFDVPVGPRPNYLRAADFDGDGRQDLVVSVAGGDAVNVLLARPQGFATLWFAAGERPTALLATDLNRDGQSDVLVAALTGADFRVLLGDGRGGFPVALVFPGTFKATSAALADLDADGLPELVVASVHTTRLSVYRNVSR
jgi:hypothetical protein